MEIAGETVGVAHQLVDIGDAKNALKQGKRVKNTSWGKDKKFILNKSLRLYLLSLLKK